MPTIYSRKYQNKTFDQNRFLQNDFLHCTILEALGEAFRLLKLVLTKCVNNFLLLNESKAFPEDNFLTGKQGVA